MKVLVYISVAGGIAAVSFPSAAAAAVYADEQNINHFLVLDVQSAEQEVFDRPAAAKYLSVSESTLRNLERAGKIVSASIGRRRVYRRQDLDAFLNSLRK